MLLALLTFLVNSGTFDRRVEGPGLRGVRRGFPAPGVLLPPELLANLRHTPSSTDADADASAREPQSEPNQNHDAGRGPEEHESIYVAAEVCPCDYDISYCTYCRFFKCASSYLHTQFQGKDSAW